MKSFFRFALLGLVLLVVALLSALTAMRFAIHGRETKVPDLVGKTPAEARRIADANGFDLEVERQYYSATVPEGRILSQLPEAGTLTRRGWQLRAAESLGPQRVQIPNAIGESERAAEINIKRRGLDVGAMAEIAVPGATADQVIAQDPPANASGVAAPKISLLTGEPAPPKALVMPSFIGQQLGNATNTLKSAGFQLGKVSVVPPPASPTSPNSAPLQPAPTTPPASTPVSLPTTASVIVSQNPPAGWKITEGAAISLEVK
jgi:beta-lactam-binding protein with PASTA domain